MTFVQFLKSDSGVDSYVISPEEAQQLNPQINPQVIKVKD